MSAALALAMACDFVPIIEGWCMGTAEIGREPSKFLASSIITTFGHLSFYKNGRAGTGGSWSRRSNCLITCNVRAAILPIVQMVPLCVF